MSLLNRIRDWWRGYSDADLRSVQAKLTIARRPGELVQVSGAELKALVWALSMSGQSVGLSVSDSAGPQK